MNSETSPAMGWIFLGLAAIAVWVAAQPNARARVHWGRRAPWVPLSAVGWAAWIGAFLTISVAGFGLLPLWTIFLTVPAVVMAGLYDSVRFHRASKRGDRT